jgi:16S rRNA (uracil1498-N3)-methyltransferase
MLGAAAIQPIVTRRTEQTVAGLMRSARVDRWRRVAIASVKQSRRATVPDVRTPLTLESYLDDPAAAIRIMLVEPGLDTTSESLAAWQRNPVPSDAAVLVGPEGGWAAEERELARAHGVRLVTLGQRTLRADAVPIAALSVLMFLWGDL